MASYRIESIDNAAHRPGPPTSTFELMDLALRDQLCKLLESNTNHQSDESKTNLCRESRAKKNKTESIFKPWGSRCTNATQPERQSEPGDEAVWRSRLTKADAATAGLYSLLRS